MTESVEHRRRRRRCVQTSSRSSATTVDQRADRGAAAQRPQLRQPDPHHPGRRCAAFPARTSTAPAAWRGAPRRRSRPTASVRATTTTCSTASTTTRPGSRRSSSSRASTRSTSSSCRPAPTRPSSAGRSAASSTCRSSRARTRLHGSAFEFHRNDAFDANNFFNNRAGRAEAGLQAEPVRRHARRPDLQGQDVLLRRLPGPCAINAGPDLPVDGAVAWRCAAATSRELNRVIYDPLTGQPFPGNIIPRGRCRPGGAQHPDPALSRAEHRRHASAPTGRRSTTT